MPFVCFFLVLPEGGGAGLWCDVVVLKLGGGSHDWTSFRNISVFFVNNGYLV